VSVWILLFPCILLPVFLCLSLGKCLINSAGTFTNPADIPPSLLSLETKDELVGSVTRLEGLSVTQEDMNSSSKKNIFILEKKFCHRKNLFNIMFDKCLPERFSNSECKTGDCCIFALV